MTSRVSRTRMQELTFRLSMPNSGTPTVEWKLYVNPRRSSRSTVHLHSSPACDPTPAFRPCHLSNPRTRQILAWSSRLSVLGRALVSVMTGTHTSKLFTFTFTHTLTHLSDARPCHPVLQSQAPQHAKCMIPTAAGALGVLPNTPRRRVQLCAYSCSWQWLGRSFPWRSGAPALRHVWVDTHAQPAWRPCLAAVLLLSRTRTWHAAQRQVLAAFGGYVGGSGTCATVCSWRSWVRTTLGSNLRSPAEVACAGANTTRGRTGEFDSRLPMATQLYPDYPTLPEFMIVSIAGCAVLAIYA